MSLLGLLTRCKLKVVGFLVAHLVGLLLFLALNDWEVLVAADKFLTCG